MPVIACKKSFHVSWYDLIHPANIAYMFTNLTAKTPGSLSERGGKICRIISVHPIWILMAGNWAGSQVSPVKLNRWWAKESYSWLRILSWHSGVHTLPPRAVSQPTSLDQLKQPERNYGCSCYKGKSLPWSFQGVFFWGGGGNNKTYKVYYRSCSFDVRKFFRNALIFKFPLMIWFFCNANNCPSNNKWENILLLNILNILIISGFNWIKLIFNSIRLYVQGV